MTASFKTRVFVALGILSLLLWHSQTGNALHAERRARQLGSSSMSWLDIAVAYRLSTSQSFHIQCHFASQEAEGVQLATA